MSLTHSLVLVGLSLGWGATELVLAFRRRSPPQASLKRREKRSLRWLGIIITASLICGTSVGLQPSGMIKFARTYMMWSGLGLMVAGIIVRVKAIHTLGKYFTVMVLIHEKHELVDKGLYKTIRHPAYAGSLVTFLGFGTAFGNWLSIIIIFLPVLIGFVYRISVEERLLAGEFGERYVNYMKRTKRLIPGIY